MSSSAHKAQNPHVSHPKYGNLPLSTSGPVPCALTGSALLNTAYFNKGAAFEAEERKQFKLTGLLPQNVQTLEQQLKRAYRQYSSRANDLAKNTFMTSLGEQNQVLYYRLIQEHLKEMFSIIYTPTEGDAIQDYSRLFRRPEGCFLNINDTGRVREDLAQWGTADDIDYIVVTDGEEILGIGDQGVGGILISVAKLVLTTVCAGIHPNRTLPVVLDCGTDNEELLNDELYLGIKKPRVRGKDYDQFVETFVKSARELYPQAYIHFEDFGLPNARSILDRYKTHIPCFNDDIQGTGCVTLAAITSGLRISKVKLSEMRMVIFGAGSAGTGIADQVRDAIAEEAGKSKEDAAKQIWCVDKPGLLLQSHGDKLTQAQRPYARSNSELQSESGQNLDTTTLAGVVAHVKPHVLIGTSTRPSTFTEAILSQLARDIPRPIILPLSNPSRLHEAKPQDIFTWTKGRALIATGSPFDPVTYTPDDGECGGKEIKYEVAECNNSTVFPGIGLGSVLCRARLVSEGMLVAAVKALASQSPALKSTEQHPDGDPEGALLPDVSEVREISVKIAVAVILKAREEGLIGEGVEVPAEEEDIEEWVREQMWDAVYRPLKLVKESEAPPGAKGELGVAT